MLRGYAAWFVGTKRGSDTRGECYLRDGPALVLLACRQGHVTSVIKPIINSTRRDVQREWNKLVAKLLSVERPMLFGFARAQACGRCGSSAEVVSGAVVKNLCRDAEALQVLTQVLEESKTPSHQIPVPRTLEKMLTDWAKDGTDFVEVGVVGVMVNVAWNLWETRTPSGGDKVEYWRGVGEHYGVFHQAQLNRAPKAQEQWGKTVRGRRVILFVDNEAASVC